MGTAIQKTSGSCMGDFGDLRSQSSAGFLEAYQRGISVWVTRSVQAEAPPGRKGRKKPRARRG